MPINNTITEAVNKLKLGWSICASKTCKTDKKHKKKQVMCNRCRKWFHDGCAVLNSKPGFRDYLFCTTCYPEGADGQSGLSADGQAGKGDKGSHDGAVEGPSTGASKNPCSSAKQTAADKPKIRKRPGRKGNKRDHEQMKGSSEESSNETKRKPKDS